MSGVHHVTYVVNELDAGVQWFEKVLGALHIPRFDHHDEAGTRFGVVLELPGFSGMIELRVATSSYPLHPGYDPITFEVADDAELDTWVRHLDEVEAEHSPIKQRRTGRSLEINSPEGILIRLFTAPAGGFTDVPFDESNVDH